MTQSAQNRSNDTNGRFIHFGGPVDEISITLRIFGDTLDPDEITELLGCTPTTTKQHRQTTNRECWLLKGTSSPETNSEQQITSLLNMLTNDLKIWQNLTMRFDVDLFCGLFMETFNRGFELSPSIMRQLAERGIKLTFDIYSEDYPPEFEEFL